MKQARQAWALGLGPGPWARSGSMLHTVYLRTLGNSGIWSFAAAGNFQNNIHNFIIGAHRASQDIIDIRYSVL